MQWRNVDLVRGNIRIVESLEQTKTGLRFKAHKTEKVRSVTLPAFASEGLKQWKRQQAEQLLELGVRQTGDTLAWCRFDGEPLQPRSLTHEFTRIVGSIADMPKVRFHDLRHSHARSSSRRASTPKSRRSGSGIPRS